MPQDPASSPEVTALQAAGEDRRQVLGTLLEEHRRRLLKMVHMRMDPRLKARVSASDVLQEAWLEVDDRIGDYLEEPKLPFFLWLRILTAQRLIRLQRKHIGAKKRDVRRQSPIAGGAMPAATSVAMIGELAARGTTPTQALARGERKALLAVALDGMKEEDRAVLVLRHFEELSNEESALELGITPAAASKRYIRALRRLHEILASLDLA